MKSKLLRVTTSLAFVGLALSVLGCLKDEIQIAAVLPLTGQDSTYGEAVRKGVELANAELQQSESLDVNLKLSIVDSQSDPEKAKELTEEQFNKGALLILGGVTTNEAKEMIPVADEYDRVLLSPSASAAELTGLSRNFYRIWPSDFASASKMAQFVSQDLNILDVVVMAEEQPYAKGIQVAFASAYEGYGGKVLETIEFPPNTDDFSGLVGRVATLGPKAVYLAAYGDDIAAMIHELKRQGFQGRILTTSAFASPRFIAAAGEDAIGTILTQSVFDLDSDYAHVKSFVNSYRAKYDEDPDIYSAHGYDALMLIATALEGRPVLDSEVPKGLREIKDFPGVTGSIQFNEKGDVLKYPRIYIIGRDQSLYDYNERVRKQQEEIRKRREELRKKLEQIQQKAQELGDEG